MMKDGHANITAVEALRAATRTADVNGAPIDTQGYESCEILVAHGLSGDTLSGSVFSTWELEESDDATTWTDVAATDMIGGNGAVANGEFARVDSPTEDETVYRVGYIGSKRYVRVVYNVTGTHTNGTPVAAVAVLGHPRHAPVPNQTA